MFEYFYGCHLLKNNSTHKNILISDISQYNALFLKIIGNVNFYTHTQHKKIIEDNITKFLLSSILRKPETIIF